jgi:hypothetical protein
VRKIVPTLGLVMIDQQHRSDGKIFGYEGGSFDALANFPVSSYCRVVNRTEYRSEPQRADHRGRQRHR